VPNNSLVVQRRAGDSEERLNNVIYIGRASFRMEPAPVSDADLDFGALPSLSMDDGTRDETRTMAPGGEYRASGNSTGLDDIEELDSNHLEIDGVLGDDGRVRAEDDAALPAFDLDQSDSAPTLRPARASWSAIGLTRSRLVVFGALAFSAGILTSAGARGLVVKPLRSPSVAAAPAAAVLSGVAVNRGLAAKAGDGTETAAIAPAPANEPAPQATRDPAATDESSRPAALATAPRAQERAETHPIGSSVATRTPASTAARPDRPRTKGAGTSARRPWRDPFAE
jgi:hypothetical protein